MFYKKRLEKSLAFILFKMKVTASMTAALNLIKQGNVQVNNKKVNLPNYICNAKDIITIKTKQDSLKIKLADYFKI
jgi:ribosomal protein S4